MTRNTAGDDSAIARVVELRQYRLRPGQREILIELFERELIEPQEAVGMQVLGQFRDLDRPDRFVWLRGFSDMEARRQGARRIQWRSCMGGVGSGSERDHDRLRRCIAATIHQPAGFGQMCPP